MCAHYLLEHDPATLQTPKARCMRFLREYRCTGQGTRIAPAGRRHLLGAYGFGCLCREGSQLSGHYSEVSSSGGVGLQASLAS